MENTMNNAQQPRVSIRYNSNPSWPGRVYFTVMRYCGPVTYRTDDRGDGAWQVREHGDDVQVLGSWQFSLTGKRGADRRRILRHFGDADNA